MREVGGDPIKQKQVSLSDSIAAPWEHGHIFKKKSEKLHLVLQPGQQAPNI